MGSHCRHDGLRPVDGGSVSGVVLASDVRLGQRKPFPRMQFQLRGMRHGVSGAGNNVPMHDMVRTVPCVGDGGHAPQFLPDEPGLEEVPDAVDIRCVAQQVPLHGDYDWVCDCVSDPVYPGLERCGLCAYGHLVGVGRGVCGGDSVYSGG